MQVARALYLILGQISYDVLHRSLKVKLNDNQVLRQLSGAGKAGDGTHPPTPPEKVRSPL